MSKPRVAITGGYGFLGWHLACRLRALHGIEPVRLGRDDFADDSRLDAALAGVDTVVHVAGVNRADTDAEVEQGNIDLAHTLSAAIDRADRPIGVVYANSVQADADNAYGRGKAQGGSILGKATVAAGGRFMNVLLPNLFGEHGRPGYNSFVATFAHAVANGDEPTVTGDREIELMHAQRAASVLESAVLDHDDGDELRPSGDAHGITEVLDRLHEMHAIYKHGEVPPLTTGFDVDLFNTYRSYRFPGMWPLSPQVFSDNRGDLFETHRSHGGTGQSFISTTHPGEGRGEHYHLHKVERFFVVKGEAEIGLRRLLHDDVITFRLSGDKPSFVDMPTLWVHNIRNVGDTELVTMFWSDQLLNRDNPDQFPEKV